MSTDEILDAILVPRPNGSAALSQVADFLEGALRAEGAEVSRHLFEATPHGFALTWSAVLLLLFAYAAALFARRYALAFAIAAAVPVLLLLEFEWMRSPVSGLWPLEERNVVGSFAGEAGGPLLRGEVDQLLERGAGAAEEVRLCGGHRGLLAFGAPTPQRSNEEVRTMRERS